MITKEQTALLESLYPKRKFISQKEFDDLGLYGGSYKELPEDNDCYYEEEDYE